ncbi:universal stress protein [Flavobacteriaceae bacterium F08102]|nr:universal stress protein [Flavobacteriaceae bacterium F08102]
MKKICIALDTSPAAEIIAKTGYEYAKLLNAEVTLVHTIYGASFYIRNYDPIMGYEGYLTTGQGSLVDNFKVESEKFLQATVNFLGDQTIKTNVLFGETHTAILDYVNEAKCNLLVIGSHSHSGFENLIMGNIAAKIVKHSEVPVLIVPIKNK